MPDETLTNSDAESASAPAIVEITESTPAPKARRVVRKRQSAEDVKPAKVAKPARARARKATTTQEAAAPAPTAVPAPVSAPKARKTREAKAKTTKAEKSVKAPKVAKILKAAKPIKAAKPLKTAKTTGVRKTTKAGSASAIVSIAAWIPEKPKGRGKTVKYTTSDLSALAKKVGLIVELNGEATKPIVIGRGKVKDIKVNVIVASLLGRNGDPIRERGPGSPLFNDAESQLAIEIFAEFRGRTFHNGVPVKII